MKCPLQLAESWKQISLWTCNFKFWQPQGSRHFPYEKPFLSLHGFPVPLEQSLCLLTCLSFQGKCLRGQINPLGPQKLLQKLVFPGSHWQVEPGWQESKTRAVIRAFQLFCGCLATFPCGHNWASNEYGAEPQGPISSTAPGAVPSLHPDPYLFV